jgi:hypothetical protein
MKLLQVGWAHPRNSEFIIRACKLFNIEYHYTNSNQFPDNQYDIIWCPQVWVDPYRYPTSKFIFGPHFWVFPDPSCEVFTKSKPEYKHRCIYVCLSDWIVKVFQEFADIANSNIPFVPIPFGLEDIPIKTTTEYEYDCILYCKLRHPSIYDFCKSFVESKGLRYKIYNYGSYNREEYMNTLKKTKFVIWIGRHESQGFALEECLATNTPIYLYDVTTMKDEYANGFIYNHHKENLLATVAPYWNDQCGLKVYSQDEFIRRFDEFVTKIPTYSPAKHMKDVLSDKICFQRFLDALSITGI